MQSDSTLQLLVSTQYVAQGVAIQSILSRVVIWAEKNKTLLYTNVMPRVFKETDNEIKHLLNFASKNNWIYRDEINNKTRPYNHHDIKHRFIRVFLHLHSSSKDAILSSIRTNNCLTDTNKCACIRKVYDHELNKATESQYTDKFDIPWMQEFKSKKQLLVNLYNTVQHLDRNNLSYLMFWSSEWQAKRDFWTQTGKYACGPAHALTYIKTPSQHDSEKVQLCAYHCTYDNKLLQPENGFLFQELEKLSQDDYTNIVQQVCRLGVDSYIEKNSRIQTMSVNEQKCFDVIKSDMVMKMERESTKFLETHQDISYRADPPLMPNANCNLQTEAMFMTGMPVRNTSGRGQDAWAYRERQGNNNLSREEQAFKRTWYQEETERRGGEMHADLGYKKRRNAHSKNSQGSSSYGPAYSGSTQLELEEAPTVANGTDNTDTDFTTQISNTRKRIEAQEKLLKTTEASKTLELQKYNSMESEMRGLIGGCFDSNMCLSNLAKTNIWTKLQKEYQEEKNKIPNKMNDNATTLEMAFARHPCAWLAKYDIGFKLLNEYRTQTVNMYTQIGNYKQTIATLENQITILEAKGICYAGGNEQDYNASKDAAKNVLTNKKGKIVKDINAWKNEIDDNNKIEFIRCGVEAVRKMYEEQIPDEIDTDLEHNTVTKELVERELDKAKQSFNNLRDKSDLTTAVESFKSKAGQASTFEELQKDYQKITGQKSTDRATQKANMDVFDEDGMRKKDEAISICGKYQIVTTIRLKLYLSKKFHIQPDSNFTTHINSTLQTIRQFQNTCNDKYHRVKPMFYRLQELSLELAVELFSTKQYLNKTSKAIETTNAAIQTVEKEFEFSLASCANENDSSIHWKKDIYEKGRVLINRLGRIEDENLDAWNRDLRNKTKEINERYTKQLSGPFEKKQINEEFHRSNAIKNFAQVLNTITQLLVKIEETFISISILRGMIKKVPQQESDFLSNPHEIISLKPLEDQITRIIIRFKTETFKEFNSMKRWIDDTKGLIELKTKQIVDVSYECWQKQYALQRSLNREVDETPDKEEITNWEDEDEPQLQKLRSVQTFINNIKNKIQVNDKKIIPIRNLYALLGLFKSLRSLMALQKYFSNIFPGYLNEDGTVIEALYEGVAIIHVRSNNPFFLFFDPI